jgi:hypothetical protein
VVSNSNMEPSEEVTWLEIKRLITEDKYREAALLLWKPDLFEGKHERGNGN